MSLNTRDSTWWSRAGRSRSAVPRRRPSARRPRACAATRRTRRARASAPAPRARARAAPARIDLAARGSAGVVEVSRHGAAHCRWGLRPRAVRRRCPGSIRFTSNRLVLYELWRSQLDMSESGHSVIYLAAVADSCACGAAGRDGPRAGGARRPAGGASSSALASEAAPAMPLHAVNDFRKLCRLESYTPTDNVSEALTARTNDDGWGDLVQRVARGLSPVRARRAAAFSVGGGSRERVLDEPEVRSDGGPPACRARRSTAWLAPRAERPGWRTAAVLIGPRSICARRWSSPTRWSYGTRQSHPDLAVKTGPLGVARRRSRCRRR